MAEEEIVIEYYNKHNSGFVTFFVGTKENAKEFMKLYGHLHRIYHIYGERKDEAQKEPAAI